MLTIHGIHEWDIVPGLPDTGGQNVFVNQFSQALADHGLKITIANRGGYPHPLSEENREGYHYKDENQRILYLEDGLNRFVRKEDMAASVLDLVASLKENLDNKSTPIDLIVSHYWDAGKVGSLYNQSLEPPAKHIWIPHSLGTIKKENVSAQLGADLKLDQRIGLETEIIQVVDGIGSTSTRIESALREDYGYTGPLFWLPPCVDTDRFYPRPVQEDDFIWEFLGHKSRLSPQEIRTRQIITEISRMDRTKRKNVLIEAFAQVHKRYPATLLVISLDQTQKELARELIALIHARRIEKDTAVVGSVWDQLPSLYAVTDIYCTPSIMEGFGMSAQQAAATRVPIIASDKVPFATEYLLDRGARKINAAGDSGQPLLLGAGAIVVPGDDVGGFAQALEILLEDGNLRQEMGERAYNITIPKFTWKSTVNRFLVAVNIWNSNSEEYQQI